MRRVVINFRHAFSILAISLFFIQIVTNSTSMFQESMPYSTNLEATMIGRINSDFTSIYRDEIIELETSMYISEDERILFDNCTIIATQDYCNIIITNGGFLNLEDTCVKSVGDFEWYLVSEEGSSIELTRCEFYAGYTTKELIHISGVDSVIQNCTFFNHPQVAIKIHDTENIQLNNNNISDSEIGIELSYGSDVILSGNLLNSNGIAIEVIRSSEISIENNSVIGSHFDGVFVDNTNNIKISHNILDSVNENAIHVRKTRNATLVNNHIIHSNISGIRFFECKNSYIENNTLDTCHSISIEYAEDISISSNSIYCSSGNGIEIYESEAIDVVLNDITLAQGWGISCNRVEDICIFGSVINQSVNAALGFWESSGRVFMNAFIQPFSDPIEGTELNSIKFCNAKYGNYYSSHQGEDEDGDLIADEPYTIAFGLQDLYPIMSAETVISKRFFMNYIPPQVSLDLEIYQDMSYVTFSASTNSSIEIMSLNYSVDASNVWNIIQMTRRESSWSSDIMIGRFNVIQFEIILQDQDGNINSTSTFDYELQPSTSILSISNPISILFILIIFPIGTALLFREYTRKPTLVRTHSQYLIINLQHIISKLTIDKCWNFLKRILNREMYSVVSYLFREFLQDSISDYSRMPQKYGWRNKYQMHLGAKVSKRQVYSHNGVVYLLLKNALISKRESTRLYWGRQRFQYRINTEYLLFQIMIDLN
ncbi:MAG: hypothetical protein GF411_03445 [Candidatus Lokiarchaeota archaeon]|nr:hypothetical protein [Candidatus Lokiarchaeota archaeon]